MPKIKNIHRIEQPRERMEKYGLGKLSDAELLAILLRTGTKDLNVVNLSKKILKKFKNEKISEIGLKEFKKIHGLGIVKACEIVACFELGRRFLKGKKSVLLLSPKDVWRELEDIKNNKKEHFVIFFLDARNQEIKREIISVGSLNANLVHPREVFEPAVRYLTAQIIIAHNHPSGNPEPSEDDLETTKRLVEAGKILGIEIIDHIIVTKNSFVSFKEKNLI